MRKIKQTMESTRVVDRTFISKEALQSMVDHVKEHYLTIWNGHDPRLPPIGRVADAELVQTGENSFEAVGELEFFDDTTTIDGFGKKEIPVKEFSEKHLQIKYDKKFLSDEDQAIISEISNLFKHEAIKEGKHCLDHVAIISICASFLLGTIATGFLKKLGEDSYIILKNKLSKLLKNKNDENVLMFEFCVEKDGHIINAEIFSTNPTSSEIEYMLSKGLADFESKLLPLFYNNNLSIRRLVFEQKNKNIQLKFAVRKDGVPMELEISDKQK